MKIIPSLVSLALASTLVTGCTTKKYYTTGGPDGGPGGPVASVSNIQPSVTFTGRTLDVQITGSDTSWDATTTVDFGAGITVNKITVASASALIANVTIADTATLGARDVTVKAGSDSEGYKMTFTVNAPVAVKTSGNVNQGAIFEVIVTNNDPKNTPFDTTTDQSGSPTNIAFVNLPAGIQALPTAVTASELRALILVDVMAAAAPVDLDIFSGPNATATTPAGDEYKLGAAFTVTASTPAALTNNMTVSLTDPFASKMFKYTPTAMGDFLAFTALDTGASSTVVLLDSTGSFANADLIKIGATISYTAPKTTPLYVLIWDQAGAGALSVSTTFFDVAAPATHAGGEGTDTNHQNDPITGAVALTPPTIVKDAAFLATTDMAGNPTTTDLDTYKITVTAGQRIYAFTAAGTMDGAGAAGLQFLDSTGAPIADASGSAAVDDTGGYSGDYTGALTAGTYYVQVSFPTSSFLDPAFDPTATHYDLTVVVQ